MKIPQTDIKSGYLQYKQEIDEAVQKVLNSGWYILGDELKKIEHEFSKYIGRKYGIGVANGTDAIELALRAAGIIQNNIVFTVSHTAVATITAIDRIGAIPYLIDIDPERFTMDPDLLEKAIINASKQSKHIGIPKAIVLVHLYGLAADISTISDIAKHHNLIVIEDCAQAHGAEFNKNKIGSFGELAAFSFYPTKNLGAFGDAGMVVCDDEKIAQTLQYLRQYGWKERFISSEKGTNSRMDEIQASILRIKLKFLDVENRNRRKIAKYYDNQLNDSSVSCPTQFSDSKHVYHQYVIKTKHRDKLKDYLSKNGIGSAIHYPVPVHKQEAYQSSIIIPKTGLPITEEIVQKILSLPIWPFLTEEQTGYITDKINSYF